MQTVLQQSMLCIDGHFKISTGFLRDHRRYVDEETDVACGHRSLAYDDPALWTFTGHGYACHYKRRYSESHDRNTRCVLLHHIFTAYDGETEKSEQRSGRDERTL